LVLAGDQEVHNQLGAFGGFAANTHPPNRRFRHMLDDEGHPRFILANQRVTLKPLSQSVSLLLGNEGEGDRTREWCDAHRRYFSRQASQDGFEFEDDIPTVFERFEVVWPLDVAETRSE
jgi:uncharacterized protein YhfF